MSSERRITDRVKPDSHEIIVLDRIENSRLGTIANISQTGFMLVSAREIDIDSVFQLELNFPDQSVTIELGAICLWNSKTGAAGVHWQGFHIIDISEASEQKLKQMLEKLPSQ